MIIRRMRVEDVDLVHEIGSGCSEFKSSLTIEAEGFWSQEALFRWCRSKSDVLLVATEHGEMIGFSLFACHAPTGKVCFENQWVRADKRSQGVGRRMVAKALTLLRRRGYVFVVGSVELENAASRAFLEASGFTVGKTFAWLDRWL